MNKQFQVSFSPNFFLLRLEEQATQQNKQCDDLKKRKELHFQHIYTKKFFLL